MKTRRWIFGASISIFSVALLGSQGFGAEVPTSVALTFAGGAAQLLPQGAWGGANVEFDVTAKGANYDQGCLYGEVLSPIPENPDGTFTASGTVFGQDGVKIPATYFGILSGTDLTLTILYTDPTSKLPTAVTHTMTIGGAHWTGPIC